MARPSPSPAPGPPDAFTPATREWFATAFAAPTTVQCAAWAAIHAGENALVVAPTGSGKTLAAFLLAIDRLFAERGKTPAPSAQSGATKKAAAVTRVLYVSPLKALGADVHKNLDAPLRGIAALREKRGDVDAPVTTGMRTGDTPAAERARLVRRPPDILITTPESLYLMLTSKARETLRGVRTVIIDEVHAVAGTKRGSHLALSLERLDRLLPSPAQRVGLSATVRPVERVAAFLGGALPVTVVNPPSEKRLDLRIVVPVEDMADLPVHETAGTETSERAGRVGSIWFHVEAAILERVLGARSTIVFVNSRGLAERLTARLNELYAERFNGAAGTAQSVPMQYDGANGGTGSRSEGIPALIARSHHGSVSKEQRAAIEGDLKSGELRCVVATSSLELGIDMGQVDLVIQVAAPPSAASGLQRVGRASHHVGGTPSGLLYPRTRRDLIDAAVTVENMLAGRLEALSPPRNPLDILAQQTVAAVSMENLAVEEWYAAVRRADPFRTLPRSAFDATLDMLAGRFPSDEFAEFRPRLVWDRVNGTLAARPGAQRLAVVNGGTIPDRGTYRVVLPEGEEQAGSRRVGELDEEMVHESRVNDVITLGAGTWRIRQISTDQVVVTPAPGKSARLPFWRGDGPGRPAELGEAIGIFLRGLDEKNGGKAARERLRKAGLDGNAVSNLLRFLEEQRAATGSVPTDKTLVVERCRDELGDWRVMLHSPYGRQVHAPWALAVADRVRRRFSVDAAVIASDDGIVARIPATEGRLPGAELFLFEADAMQRLITEAVGTSALFAARFRECASRALLLPRRAPGRRSPLWQQRLRAGQLLEVARGHPNFPILLETARECLQDVYDLPALYALMRKLGAGDARLVESATDTPSPFAANLLFGYVGEFLYDGDTPLAERRASVLSLDSSLLADLLGQADFGELLDPAVSARVEAELQHLAPERRVSGMEGAADLLRELGPLSPAEVAERLTDNGAQGHLDALAGAGRAIRLTIAGETRWAAVEDAARLRDALGVSLPDGIPDVFLKAVPDPVRDLAARYARTHGPFTTASLAARYGVGVAVGASALERLREEGRVLRGDFGVARQESEEKTATPLARHEWVWEEVFRRLRARSLQAAREATKPVDGAAYARLLLERQNVVADARSGAFDDPALGGVDGVLRAVEQLAGLSFPASLWESHILPARVRDYAPGMLDELTASGEILWSGGGEGQVSLHPREFAAETLPELDETMDLDDLQRAILDTLKGGGAFFAHQLGALAAKGASGPSPEALRTALWGLAWAGYVTTDSWAPLRALGADAPPVRRTRTVRQRMTGGAYRTHTYTQTAGLRSPAFADPTLAGRWSLLPREAVSETARALALAEGLLDRYGVVTRGAAVFEKVPGGFPALQHLFRGMEDAGRILRGRFVDGLGASQFADHIVINRLRELAETPEPAGRARAAAAKRTAVLSAVDPANPFGAVLPWPESPGKSKPLRRPGALVAISDGRLLLWLAQGGRSLLTFTTPGTPDNGMPENEAVLRALAAALTRRSAATFTIHSIDDAPASSSPFASVLREAGFSPTPQGLCWFRKLRS